MIFSIFIVILSRMQYQNLYLWKSIDILIVSGFINISLFFLLHLIIGLTIFWISFYQCIEIVKINNKAHETKSQPTILLEDGYYGAVRHPMTTRFLFIIFSFFFMMGSLLGIPFIFLFAFIFVLITFYEEKKILIPTFGNKYKEYMKRVKRRFFTIPMKLILSILVIFIVLGAIFI